jgi:UPF0176 protein
MQVHSAFYQFTKIPDPQAMAQLLRHALQALHGTIIVAQEGINGVLAGELAELERAEKELTCAPQFAPYFSAMPFKRSECTSNPFGLLRIRVKPELVQLGAPEITAHFGPSAHQSLGAEQWRQLLNRDDVVVLDNRNHFEYRLGHFVGAVNPQVEHFRDFTQYVNEHAPGWKAEGKKIAMYCTGGIRCEKTSGWMQALGLDVAQLDGGILHYFQSNPEAQADWVGECFVFDNRVALNTALKETATTEQDVYTEASERWRLERALHLAKLA